MATNRVIVRKSPRSKVSEVNWMNVTWNADLVDAAVFQYLPDDTFSQRASATVICS